MPARRSDGYDETVIGAFAGMAAGILVAIALAVGSYHLAFGGTGCRGDACEDPATRAFLVFVLAAVLGLVAGASVGCHVALRRSGLPARRLTAVLVATFALGVIVLVPTAVIALGADNLTQVLWFLLPSLVVLVPLAARFVATGGSMLGGWPSGDAPEDPPAPRPRAW